MKPEIVGIIPAADPAFGIISKAKVPNSTPAAMPTEIDRNSVPIFPRDPSQPPNGDARDAPAASHKKVKLLSATFLRRDCETCPGEEDELSGPALSKQSTDARAGQTELGIDEAPRSHLRAVSKGTRQNNPPRGGQSHLRPPVQAFCQAKAVSQEYPGQDAASGAAHTLRLLSARSASGCKERWSALTVAAVAPLP